MQLDNDLKQKSHTSHLFKPGNFLLKSFSLLRWFSLSIQNLRIIYCSYIRPCLEYACPFWHPGLTKDLCSKIESIKKKTTINLYFWCPILHTMKVWLDLNLLYWNHDVTSLPCTLVTSALVLTITDVFFPPSKKIPQSFLIQDLMLVELQIPNLTCVPKCWPW